MKLSFRLDGVGVSSESPTLTSLLVVLRDRLGVTSVRGLCDDGSCGACTVLIDGESACACLVPAHQVSGTEVTTLESSAPMIQRARAAFDEDGRGQCGACEAGVVLPAVARRRREGTVDPDGLREAMCGVRCRCTGYQSLVEAMHGALGPGSLRD